MTCGDDINREVERRYFDSFFLRMAEKGVRMLAYTDGLSEQITGIHEIVEKAIVGQVLSKGVI
jgi:hypothetical protein